MIEPERHEPAERRHLEPVPDDGFDPFAGDYGEGKSYYEEVEASMIALGMAVTALLVVVGLVVLLVLLAL